MQKMPSNVADAQTYLDYILKLGNFRQPSMTASQIKTNVMTDNQQYDFKGKNHAERQVEFMAYRKALHACIYTLFSSKLSEKTDKLSKKVPENIASFVTGIKQG